MNPNPASPYGRQRYFFYGYLAFGIAAALGAGWWPLPDGMVDWVLQHFRTIAWLCSLSADPHAWAQYFTLMLVVQALLVLPFAWDWRKQAMPRDPGRVLLGVLLLLPVLCGLWWYCTMGAPLGEGVNPVDRYSRGARMLGAMLGSRAGLALIGSIYMSGLLAFASLAVAIPLIFLKSMRRPK